MADRRIPHSNSKTELRQAFQRLDRDVSTLEAKDHGDLDGLTDDDHAQYHNDTRGDARYFRENEHINTSAGAADAGKPIILDADGEIAANMLGKAEGITDHGELDGLADDDHTIYLLADGTRNLTGNLTVTALKTIDGRDLSVDGAKLDGIEALADVTDAVNVAAAGAAMAGGAFHDGFSDFVAAEHVSLPNTIANVLTDHDLAAHTTLGLFDSSSDVDHGGVGGLTDDDHTIYLLADGTRALSGNLTVNAGITIDGRDISVDGTALDACVAASHAESHTIASHSDTTATGAELETLTNNSIANTLHRHSELVASDGSPDPALSMDATGGMTISPAGHTFLFRDSAAGNSGRLTIQSRISNNATFIDLFTRDGDGTDDIGFVAFAYGGPTNWTQIEVVELRWDQDQNEFALDTLSAGARPVRPLNIYTSGNSGQIYLNIDGSVSMGGALSVTGNITGPNVTTGANPGHTHTGTSLSAIDISDDTNLAATAPVILTDDTLSLDYEATDFSVVGTTLTITNSGVDHNTTTNTHNLTTDIDHASITNTHNLTTDINHASITGAHNLTTDIDHNALTNYAANQHVALPNTIANVLSDHDLAAHTGLGLFDQHSDVDHDQTTNYVANEHIDWTNASVALTTTGEISGPLNKAHLMRSFFDGLQTYTCFDSYDSTTLFTSGSGGSTDSFGSSQVYTGATAGSAARRHINNAGWNFRTGRIFAKLYLYGYTQHITKFSGISATLLTTQTGSAHTFIHAGLWYDNGTWYASVADGAAQTTVDVTAYCTSGMHTLEIEGLSESGHVKFWIDGTVRADITTNLPATGSSMGYMQWYVNNEALTASYICAVFSTGYVQ